MAKPIASESPTAGAPDREWATWLLAGGWVAVYVAMAWSQGSLQYGGDLIGGGIDPRTAIRFGAISPDFILDGEIWRAIDATMIHFSLVHLFVNLVGLVTLGRMIESWYGPWGTLAVYTGIAFAGNLVAALAKAGLRGVGDAIAPWVGPQPLLGPVLGAPSAGGSVVVCGLVALVAVVGRRSKSRFGDFVWRQMIAVLGLTAILGLALPVRLDNIGHAAGALVGAAIGFAHHWFVRQAGRPRSRALGVLACVALVGSIAAQAVNGWNAKSTEEPRTQGAEFVSVAPPSPYFDRSPPEPPNLLPHQMRFPAKIGLVNLVAAVELHRELGRRGPIPWATHDQLTGEPPARLDGRLLRKRLASTVKLLGSTIEIGPSGRDHDMDRIRDLTRSAWRRAPTPGEERAFEVAAVRLFRRLELVSKVRLPRMAPPQGSPDDDAGP
jgi:membrane associated rhomboid family serine protease